MRSLSARRAWIEILNAATLRLWACPSLSARRAWIEMSDIPPNLDADHVALRKESVDRNKNVNQVVMMLAWSLSARRAWIEMKE